VLPAGSQLFAVVSPERQDLAGHFSCQQQAVVCRTAASSSEGKP